MTAPDELIIEPKDGQPADACVFIIHGLGADGHDFEPLVPALALPKDSHVRFIMPHAPCATPAGDCQWRYGHARLVRYSCHGFGAPGR